ncbi:hypothetical protein PTMSG1_04134 [Pyrenophora teres f. maculata]|nr:hypothetical protein PTMSG1_04134 [Pyrenophora teres f. maculata]
MQNDIAPMTNQAGPVMQPPTELEIVSDKLMQEYGDAGLLINYDHVNECLESDVDMLSSYDPSSPSLEHYISLLNEASPVHSDQTYGLDYSIPIDYNLGQLSGYPDSSSLGKDYDFEPMAIDDHPDSWITEEEKAGLDEFAQMLIDMGISPTSEASSASAPIVDDMAGSELSPVSVDVESPLPPDEPDLRKAWPSINPFTMEICKANVTYCHDKAPSEELSSLDYFAMEYVRSVRFLKVKKRWSNLPIAAWMREVDLLTKAVTKPDSKLKLWPPLQKTLVLYHSNVGDVVKQKRILFKRTILAQMVDVGKLQMKANKEAVEELLTALKLKLHRSSCAFVRKEVDEDCSNRGSLLLGKLAEFQNLSVAMHRKWFWVD